MSSGLPAGPGQPPIVARRAWAQGGAHPKVAPEYGNVQLAFVHHTENPDGYSAAEVPSMLRSIYEFHRYGRGWNDIGYNFVIDRFGRIFEARAGGIDEPVVGAQAGGYNAYSTGIAILGHLQRPADLPAGPHSPSNISWLGSCPCTELRSKVASRCASPPRARCTAVSLLTLTSRCPAWRAIATPTPPTVPAMPSTRSCNPSGTPPVGLVGLCGRATLRFQPPASPGASAVRCRQPAFGRRHPPRWRSAGDPGATSLPAGAKPSPS